MDSQRLNKLQALLQEDIAEIFRQIGQGKFPGTLISVTHVKVTPDLSIARIYLSIFPASRKEDIMNWATSNKGFVKDQIVKKVKGSLRKMPDLEFFLDDSLDYKDNIDRLLRGEGENPIS